MLATTQYSFISFVIMQRHPNNKPLFEEKCAKISRMFQNKRRAAFLRRWLLQTSWQNLSLSLFFGDNDTFGYPGNLLFCAWLWMEVYGLAVAFERGSKFIRCVECNIPPKISIKLDLKLLRYFCVYPKGMRKTNGIAKQIRTILPRS